MAIYQYTAPDGHKYRVEAPEGATDQQVYGLVLQNYPYAGQTTKELEDARRAPTSIKDIGLATGQGLAGGIQSLTNLFGVDNAASQYLGNLQQSAAQAMTPERQEEIARRQELRERAKGDLSKEISTGIGGFFEAPLQTGLQALASSVPIIAGGLLPGGQVAAGASLGARALAGARGATGIGGLMGVGGQKGQDYEAVKQALLDKGVDPVIAEQRAQEAAAYSLANTPRQFAAGAAGALEGAFGVEQALANAAKKVSKAKGAPALDAPTFKRAVGESVLGEAVPEAIQAGVGQIGTNVALNQAGIPTDYTEGLAGTVAHDALVGAVLGLAVSPAQMSNLQREHKQAKADELAKKQAEFDREREAAAQKAAAERAVLEKQTEDIRQQMEQQQAIALPAPSEEIPAEEVQTDPLKNPLGNIRKNEVPFDIYKQIDEYRKQAGLPKLKEYSIEDFVDAMPGVNPKAEQALLDELITAKSGYAGEKYTAEDVINQAKRKNVETQTQGFKDFLARATGVNALEKMSQPQLHAAFKALANLPEGTDLNILPEGTNARRFDEKQYSKAIKAVDDLLGEVGAPVDPKEVIRTIKEYTNLTEDSHAGAILDTAIKNGDLDIVKTPRYEVYDPKTGKALPSTYTSKVAAQAAAKNRGLNVRNITAEAIAAPSTSVTLPEGFDIREGAFKEGEAPAGYDVTAGDEVLFKANTVEEANDKKASFEKTRAGMAHTRENQITQLNNAIEASQKRLNTMEAQGKGQTTGYQKAAGKHAKLVADTQAKIAALTEEIKKYDPKTTPLEVKPTGTKAIGRKGHTVFEQGQARATYPSRQAAEEGILSEMSDKQLQELAQQQGRRAIGKKAQAELERRAPKAPTEAEAKRFAQQKPVSEVLKDIEEKKAKAEAPKETPGAKERIAQFEALLKPMLKKFGLDNVGLKISEDLQGDGSYADKLIKIALTAKDPRKVMRHESIHALKELGFFTPEQWKALERMAKDQWIDKYLKRVNATLDGKTMTRYEAYVKLYKGNQDMIIEEAIADAFADFANNKPPAGMLAALMKRLNDFFTALRNALNGAGFQTYEDVFGKVERGELKAGTTPTQAGGNKFSLFPEGAPLSTRPVMEADDTAARELLGLNTTAKRGRYNNVRDIARALNDDTLKNFGAMDRKQLTDDDVVKIANAIADEVSYQLGTTAKTGTGLGWYSNNYPNAVKRLQSRFPELADNKHARSVFSAIVAVTSNGEKVTKNIANAVELYAKLREGKTMVAMGNRRATALENNLRSIERLLEDHGQNFEKHLLEEITVKDMNAYLRGIGEKSDGSYLADTVVPRAAIYFGPKLGAFYANLSGSEGYLTMDLWWTRSINRMRGLLIPKATEASIEKFRDMMDQPEADRDEVAAAAIPLRNKYKDYGFTTELEHLVGAKEPSTKANKPAWFKRAEKAAGDAYEQLLFEHNLEKMANTIYKNEYEMLEEAPFTATDRAFMYKAARNAQKTLRKSGIDLTLADIQAALWYYEKRLYAKLSGVKADDIGYEEAIINQASEGGGRARPSVVFGRGTDLGADTGRALQRAEEAGREPADGERLSLRQFDPKELPQNKKEYTLPANTVLYHGTHEARAKEIESAGKVLISRSPIKTNGGATDEGGLIYFGGKNTAQHYATKGDPGAARYAEEKGEKRKPGQVFETVTDRPYRLMNKDYVLTQKEADALNEALGIPDYKLLKKGDTANTAALRAINNSRTVERYKTDKGEMVVAWPKIFETLGYDGFYDEFAVVLPADNGIRLMGKEGKMERFSLRVPTTEGFKKWVDKTPIIRATNTGKYKGGSAVFQAFHGSTFNDITVFDTERGHEKGALGAGAYFTTSPQDASLNYAGIGPDLQNNLRQRQAKIDDAFYYDYTKNIDKMQEYFDDNNIKVDAKKLDPNAVNWQDNSVDRYREDAAKYLAYKQLVGPSKGVVMPVYIKLLKPFDMTRNEIEFLDDKDLAGTPVDAYGQLTEVIRDLAAEWGIRPDDFIRHNEINARKGMTAYQLYQNAQNLTVKKNPRTGQFSTPQQFLQEVLKELGYDGIIQDASTSYSYMAGINRTTSPTGNRTFHIMPFDSRQIKSATGNIGTYDPTNADIRYSLRQVDDFFQKADSIKEPEGVEIIRENWIGTVSGLGDRDSAYDLYRVQGGKQYIDDVQNLVRDELGESFKGYRLMSVDELEEIKAGAMGSQLASFTLRPDIAHAFANLASYRKIPKDQLRVVEMDLTPEHVVMVGHPGERELVIDYGQGYNPDAVVEKTVGSYEQYNPTERYSLRDSTDPDIVNRVNETTTTREEKGFADRITKAFSGDTFSEIRQKALNRYQRLAEYDKELADRMGGVALMADASAEAGALQSDLAAGVTASALGVHDRNGGIPVYANGVTKVFNDGGKIKGPVAIFAPLSKYNDPFVYQLYQFWSAAQRGSRLNEQGRPDIFTDADLVKAQQLEKDYPEFRQIREEWNVYNNGLMQYLVDTGVLSEGDRAKFTEFSDYIPFYRQMEGEKTIGPNLFQSISGVKKPRKLEEGTDKAPLADFLETIVRNTQSSIQMGMKNVAAQRAIDVAMKIDMAERLPPNSKAGLDTVQVLENGKVVTYQVADPLFIEAVKSLNMPDLPFIGLLAGPANFLRNMVTKDPGFMLANMVRDSMSAYVTSGVKMTPVADTIRNFGSAMAGTSPEYEALLNAGILGGYEFSQNIEMSGKAFERELKKKQSGKSTFERLANPLSAPRALWEMLEKGTTASDAATRIEVYKRTLAETGNEAEALHRALEVMNFNRKGSSAVVRILTAAIPFLNARMQGLDVLYRAGISPTFRQLAYGEKPTDRAKAMQKAFIVRGLTMAALSAMYWSLTHDDDEYKKQEQETKDNNWLVPSLGVKIPIPFEIGVIFKVIPERIMALTLGQDTNKDFMDSMARNLRSTLAIDYLPQAIKPFVETETNFSLFTRRPIVGQGLEGVAPQYQIGPGTSSVATFLGTQLGMSPMKIDHLIQGYTGTMGMYMTSALDGIMNMNAETPNASKRFEQMPFIKRFALDPEARGTVTSYYDLKNATDEVVRTSNLLERTMNFKERNEFMKENIKLLANKDYILDLEKTMKEFRQAQVMIRSSKMDPDAKRDALLRINQAQNALTANINFLKANVM